MQKRFGECADDKLRRLAHMGVSWGFMGMFLATLIILGVDYNMLPLPRWVSLVIGSVSGVACSLGLGYYFYLRLKGKTAVGKYSHPSDWAFLLLLALSVLSGYVMLFFRFTEHAHGRLLAPSPSTWSWSSTCWSPSRSASSPTSSTGRSPVAGRLEVMYGRPSPGDAG